jgi:hypothetical protein
MYLTQFQKEHNWSKGLDAIPLNPVSLNAATCSKYSRGRVANLGKQLPRNDRRVSCAPDVLHEVRPSHYQGIHVYCDFARQSPRACNNEAQQAAAQHQQKGVSVDLADIREATKVVLKRPICSADFARTSGRKMFSTTTLHEQQQHQRQQQLPAADVADVLQRHVPAVDIAKQTDRPSAVLQRCCKAEYYEPEEALARQHATVEVDFTTGRGHHDITSFSMQAERLLRHGDRIDHFTEGKIDKTRPRTGRDRSLPNFTKQTQKSEFGMGKQVEASSLDKVTSWDSPLRHPREPVVHMSAAASRDQRDRAYSPKRSRGPDFYDSCVSYTGELLKAPRGVLPQQKNLPREKTIGGRLFAEMRNLDVVPGPGTYTPSTS